MQLNTPHNHKKKRTASDTLGGVPVVRYIMSSLSYQFFPVNSCFQVLLITFFSETYRIMNVRLASVLKRAVI